MKHDKAFNSDPDYSATSIRAQFRNERIALMLQMQHNATKELKDTTKDMLDRDQNYLLWISGIIIGSLGAILTQFETLKGIIYFGPIGVCVIVFLFLVSFLSGIMFRQYLMKIIPAASRVFIIYEEGFSAAIQNAIRPAFDSKWDLLMLLEKCKQLFIIPDLIFEKLKHMSEEEKDKLYESLKSDYIKKIDEQDTEDRAYVLGIIDNINARAFGSFSDTEKNKAMQNLDYRRVYKQYKRWFYAFMYLFALSIFCFTTLVLINTMIA